MTMPETDDDLRARMAQYTWYHCVEVEPGILTPGVEHFRHIQTPVMEALRSLKLTGARVLDIGCRDGLFAIEAERLGAADVIGIDNNVSIGAVEFLLPRLGSRVRMVEMNMMDLVPATFGKFDVIIFAGVLYHLRYPFLGLRLIRDVMQDGAALIIETAVYRPQEDLPLLYCPTGDDSPYEPTSVSFFSLRALSETLASFGIVVEAQLSVIDDPLTTCISRATLLCRYHGSEVDDRIQAYWDGTHVINTTYGDIKDYLREVPRKQGA